MKTRTKKVLGTVALAMLLAAGIPLAWGIYSYNKQVALGGYIYAGIPPILGATVVSIEHIDESMFGGTTVWVYKLPPGYAEALYKDCSRIGYQQGTYRDSGDGTLYIDRYVKANEPGCYLTKTMKDDNITAQFGDDELIVQDMY